MEESQHWVQNNKWTYRTSILVAGLLFGIISFALTLTYNYTVINSEPTGATFSPYQFIGIFSCLLVAFGGMLATWHYAREYDVPIKLGRGALIGFLTGVCIVIVSTLLNEVWLMIDPDMTEKMIESTIANFEAMNLPGEQQQMMDGMVENVRSNQSIFSQLLWGIPVMGILNLLTGMIGAKIFGKKEETF